MQSLQMNFSFFHSLLFASYNIYNYLFGLVLSDKVTNVSIWLVWGIQGHPIVSSIRNGLVNMIPILIIGAFALILNTFLVKGNHFLNYWACWIFKDIWYRRWCKKKYYIVLVVIFIKDIYILKLFPLMKTIKINK